MAADTEQAKPAGSTKPAKSAKPAQPQLPTLGPVGWARWVWRNLTSMRTALFLLLLLAVVALPGSVFPQRNIDPGKVANYLDSHQTAGPWLDRLGFFDVYGSAWFSAVYLLLFISLLGCIIPRTFAHMRAMQTPPPKTPARPERLPVAESFTVDAGAGASADELVGRAREALRGKRFRIVTSSSGSEGGGATLASESGYARETGNIIFHLALCGVIVGMAIGHLFGWRADVIVPEGQGFSSVVGSYDTFAPGPMVDPEVLPEFSLVVEAMQVSFVTTPGRAFGQPKEFAATTKVTLPGQAPQTQELSVNHPLNVQGADIYLLGNGYAPVVTVRDKAGKVVFHEPVPFISQDPNYRSLGVVKVVSATPKQLGIIGFFLPTAEPTFANGPVSLFPDTENPEVAFSIWEGTLFPGGMPQSVFSLNTDEMKQVTKADKTPVLVRLKPGQTYTLPGDRGSITFDKVTRWAGLSVRYEPGTMFTLIAALLATAGLILSLIVRRRRLFVRVTPQGSGYRVAVGALTKDNDPALETLVAAVAAAIRGPGQSEGESEPVSGAVSEGESASESAAESESVGETASERAGIPAPVERSDDSPTVEPAQPTEGTQP